MASKKQNTIVPNEQRDYSVPPGQVSKTFRPRGQVVNFSQLKDIMLQNVSRSSTRTFTQYAKENIISYLKSPYTNLDNIREVSKFLYRVSSIYKKVVEYTAQMPLFYYNVSYKYDFTQELQHDQFMKEYYELCNRLQVIDFKKEFRNIIATAIRDGIFNGFIYDNEEEGFMIHPLDPKYCKVSAITNEGQYVISFNASYFTTGNNSEYIYGIDENGEGVWDDVFKEGYEAYINSGRSRDYQWFELPPEKTICIDGAAITSSDGSSSTISCYTFIYRNTYEILSTYTNEELSEVTNYNLRTGDLSKLISA